MTEELYDSKKFALELGFSEEDAELFGGVGADATNLRKIAKRRREKGKMPDQLVDEKTLAQVKAREDAGDAGKVAAEKPTGHRHFYRKDGTCKCGAVKGARVDKAKVAAKAKTKAEEAVRIAGQAEQEARARIEAEAADRPSFEGQDNPPDEE